MSKKIKASAFHFGDCSEVDGITSQDFWDWLVGMNGRTGWPFFNTGSSPESTRQFFCKQTGADFYGLFVTPDERVHHVVEQNRRGHSIVKPLTNENGQPNVQINFFVIRKDFLTGLYAHYRGSFPFKQFLGTLWHAYHHFCSQMMPGTNQRGAWNTVPVYSDLAFRRAVSELSVVKEIHVSSPLLLMPDDTPTPPNAAIKGTRHTIRIGGGSGRTWMDSILWLRERSQVKNRRKGFVVGCRSDNEDDLIQIDFERTMDDFLTAVYEDIGEINIEYLEQHSMISRLQRIVHDNALFQMDYPR